MPLDIYAFDNYREVLREHFRLSKKKTGRKGTSAFARAAGCSPGHVRNILEGRRDLAPELVAGFNRGLDLSGEDADYFGWLVTAIHGQSSLDRAAAVDRVRAARAARGYPRPLQKGRPGRPTGRSSEVSEPDAVWAHPILRALACCPGYQEDPSRLSEVLGRTLSPVQIAATWDLFPELRKGGGLEPVSVIVPETPAERAAFRRALSMVEGAIGRLGPPAFQVYTSQWCISVASWDELASFAEECVADAGRRLLALAERARDPELDGERQVVQVIFSLWPRSQRF